MAYKISDVIKAGGYKSTDAQKIMSCLGDSEKYKSRLSNHPIKGFLVDANMDELLSDLKPLLAAKEIELAEKKEREAQRAEAEQQKRNETTVSRVSLANTIAELKENLPKGYQYYEYKTLIIKDDAISGTTDSERIELLLNKYALEGWRLKEALTNEVGHNSAVVVNATINNTILILERLTTKE